MTGYHDSSVVVATSNTIVTMMNHLEKMIFI